MPTNRACIICLTALSPLALTILGGCSYPLRVESDYGPAIKLSALGSSFAWRPGFDSTWSDPASPGYHIRAFIRDAIAAGLEARGFVYAKSGEQTDFWVDYRYSSEVRGDPYNHLTKYEMSILVLHVIDPVSQQGIWRGWAEARAPEDSTPEQRRKGLDKAVCKLLKIFPYYPALVEPAVIEQPTVIEPQITIEQPAAVEERAVIEESATTPPASQPCSEQ